MERRRKISREEKRAFYQSKYDYYRDYNKWVVILSCLASTTYWFSDCELFDGPALDTLIPRTFILLPLLIFILVSKKVKDYRVMVPLSYLLMHGIMWCTIWAIVYLPIKQHANEGFIIMHILFFAVSFCAPFKYSIIAHPLVIANILISYTFNRYESLDQMLLLGIPCAAGILGVNYVMENVYKDHYFTKQELEDTVTLDQLTRAFNRNKMKEITIPGTNRLNVNAESTCIMLVDVDYFKNVNDTYGHESGDVVLVHTVDIIKSCVRSTDYVIRWGGEEFLVIIPGCSLDRARVIAEKMRNEVQNSHNSVCDVTISIGVSQYDGEDYHHTVANADKALYVAKDTGRNKVVIFEDI